MGCRLAEGWPHFDPRPNVIKKVSVIDERSLKKSKNITRECPPVSKVTTLSMKTPFLELETGQTGETGETEMVSKTVAQTPPPTHAGGQDDGSYTNSLKI